MKKQFILLMAFVVVCLLGATSVVVSSNRPCRVEEQDIKQPPSNDFLFHGPLNYFQL